MATATATPPSSTAVNSAPDPAIEGKGYVHPEVLVGTTWLAEHLNDPKVRIIEADEDPLLYEVGHIPGAAKLDWHVDVQDPVRRDFVEALKVADVLMMPTLPRTALRIGEAASREPRLAWNRLLTPFNLAGLPAISVPCGCDGAGLPIGLQCAGRAWDEATVLRAARAYERATDWHLARPPLAA